MLILQGKVEQVEKVLNAFNDPDKILNELKKLIRVTPYSLRGIRIVWEVLNGQGIALDFDTWPHSDLLLCAEKISTTVEFREMIQVITEMVAWSDR